MIELLQLEQLAAFAEHGTLSKAAEKLHMSQPTLTRAMQKLESEFGVLLFSRTKNKLEFNDNGKLAADYAKKILEQTDDMINIVRGFDRKHHTLCFGCCAPMPMLTLLQNAAHFYSDMAVSAELKDNETLLKGLQDGTYHIIILPYQLEQKEFICKEYGTETLYFALLPEHKFADSKGIFMKDLDGENMLLYSEIGFWYDLTVKKMPHSRFLVQNDRFAFDELVQASVLPSFVTDIAIQQYGSPNNRKIVTILDREAKANYYAVCLKTSNHKIQQLILSNNKGEIWNV